MPLSGTPWRLHPCAVLRVMKQDGPFSPHHHHWWAALSPGMGFDFFKPGVVRARTLWS
jgi:hypothetical protein